VGDLPRPPLRLARRVGELDPADPWGHFDPVGRQMRERIDASLPAGWDWTGRVCLDFGCGAGRVLRQFASEAAVAELWGCDIDAPSIEWLDAELSPPFHALLVSEDPGIDRPDDSFDLIWATSVFTHLTDNWAGWLSELNRVLKPGGLLMASILGPGMWAALVEEDEWEPDRVGMCVIRAGAPWSIGGPAVFHSEWWLREHWGRGFEIVALDPGAVHWSHGWVVLRKIHDTVDAGELERVSDDPREVTALQHALALAHADDRRLRPRYLRLTGRNARDAGRWWARRVRSLVGWRWPSS
jgi:SAM-dependent methyltransferase